MKGVMRQVMNKLNRERKMRLKQFGSSTYRQLRAKGCSHSEAFKKVGNIMQSKISEAKKIRFETKQIRPVNGYNKTSVRKFTKKFEIGTIEKDKSLASNNNEPLSYVDEIGGFKDRAKAYSERIADKEIRQTKRITQEMSKCFNNEKEQLKKKMSLFDSLLTSGQYKVEKDEIRIGCFVFR